MSSSRPEPRSPWKRRLGFAVVIGVAAILASPWIGTDQGQSGVFNAPFGSYEARTGQVSTGGSYSETKIARVDSTFFGSATPYIGRLFEPEEYDATDGQRAWAVAVLTHDFWQARLGSDPSVIGRSISMDGADLTIVGIMPPGAQGPEGTEVFYPRATILEATGPDLSGAIGSCYAPERMATPAGFRFADVLTHGGDSSRRLHLVHFSPAGPEERATRANKYLVVHDVGTTPCSEHWLDLTHDPDDDLDPLGVAEGDVLVLNFKALNETDGRGFGYSLLVQPDGEIVALESEGGPVRMMPWNEFLLNRNGLIHPSGQTLRFDDFSSDLVQEVHAVNDSTALVIRCPWSVCGPGFRFGEGKGSAQIVSWAEGLIADFPFAGILQSAINDYQPTLVDTTWSEQSIAMLDHSAGVLTVIDRRVPGEPVVYRLDELRQVEEMPDGLFFEAWDETEPTHRYRFYFPNSGGEPTYWHEGRR